MSRLRILGDCKGVPIISQNGRYGSYMTRGTDIRTMISEVQLFTIAEAIELYKPPKVLRRGDPKPPLKKLGSYAGDSKNFII